MTKFITVNNDTANVGKANVADEKNIDTDYNKIDNTNDNVVNVQSQSMSIEIIADTNNNNNTTTNHKNKVVLDDTTDDVNVENNINNKNQTITETENYYNFDTDIDNDNEDDDPTTTTTTDNNDDDGTDGKQKQYGDVSYRPGGLVLYSKPIQRQQWDEQQVLPRVNWGDLFFDLFYVAAGYNISYIIVNSPSRYGFLYSIGTYWPLYGIFINRMYYDSRFVLCTNNKNIDDIFHRVYEIVNVIILSIAVLAIRPVYIMSNSSKYINMFIFSIAITIDRILLILKYIELYLYGIGQRSAIQQTAFREILFSVSCLPFYIASTIISGILYIEGKYSNNKKSSSKQYPTYDTNYNSTNNSSSSLSLSYSDNNSKNNTLYRLLADLVTATTTTVTDTNTSTSYDNNNNNDYSTTTTKSYQITHVPIFLCLFGYITFYFLFAVTVIFCFPSGGRHKEISVPINIGFVIHRSSEWVMLNFGESIISLLIVDLPNESNAMYSTFYCGILTIAFLHMLHFRSQPLHDDHHAMRRSKNGGILFNIFLHMYSLALLSLGAAYTAFLVPRKSTYATGDKPTRRRNLSIPILSKLLQLDNDVVDHHYRFLAGGSSSGTDLITFDTDTYNERVGQLFCFSLALVYLSLDLTTLSHLGLKEVNDRCYCKENGTNWRGLILVFIRICLMFFTATMYFWEQRPKVLSLIGLLTVLAQIFLRKLGAFFLRHRKNENEQLHQRQYNRQKLRCVTRKLIKRTGTASCNDNNVSIHY